MRVSITLGFDASHRLMHHKGKCCNLHGHHWIVQIGLEGVPNQKTGMIMDFSDLKKICNEVVDRYDHACIINAADKSMSQFLNQLGSKHVVMDGEPTCENLVLRVIQELKDAGITFPIVRIYESATTYCEETG